MPMKSTARRTTRSCPLPTLSPWIRGVVMSLALGTTMGAGAQAMPDSLRTEVSDARPLMLAALYAPDGAARGVLTGEVAEAITRRFGATSPIYVDVTTERRYSQAGCARLSVLFWQDGVLLPGAQTARRQTIEFGINYCLDGLPPKALR